MSKEQSFGQARESKRGVRAIAAGIGAILVASMLAPIAAASAASPAADPHRPGYHYTPQQNWMNDPNGLVYYKGVYHLYYQYNPYGNGWGNMNWGHATSTDLLTWTEQPLALPEGPNEWMFSGNIVVDTNNTSGLGSLTNPPLVALYTSAFHGHPVHGNRQMQSVAYSLDDGQTWTKYSGNPVLDRGSDHFRDPHVFWYDGGSPATRYWVMVAVEAMAHEVVIYKSSNLTSWTYLSTFGPANATGGQWECPDLFELAVDGNPANKKWVMVVNINPGGIAGGSGAQYFVGNFNGTTFTSETTHTSTPVLGSVVEDFADYSGWSVNNTRAFASNGPFGTTPATGTLPGQGTVTGNDGPFINSFLGGDSPIGTITSAPFTITDDYINLKIGGGNHPRAAGTGDGTPPAGYLTFSGFENPATLQSQGWTTTAGTTAMATSQPRTYADGGRGMIGDRLINTNAGFGDTATGTITSPTFTITQPNLALLVGGGTESPNLQVRLLINGAVVRTTGGTNDGTMNWRNWDVTPWLGNTTAQLQIHDQATGTWGHLLVDHMINSTTPATPRSTETTANLIINGQVVRTATGANSEALSWRSWNVTPWLGQQASIVVTDNNSGGWGHVLVDTIQLAPAPQA